MHHVFHLGDDLKVPAGKCRSKLLWVRAGEVAFASLLAIGCRGHVDSKEMITRIEADHGSVYAARVGPAPAEYTAVLAIFRASIFNFVVGRVDSYIQAGIADRQVFFQHLPNGAGMLAKPAGHGETKQLLHERQEARR